jgi:hypothetical protein
MKTVLLKEKKLCNCTILKASYMYTEIELMSKCMAAFSLPSKKKEKGHNEHICYLMKVEDISV